MKDSEFFQQIRPYDEKEIPSAINRILSNDTFYNVGRWLFPDKSKNEIIEIFRSVSTADDFQVKVMYPAMKSILAQTSSELTYGGLENLSPEKSYLFISNHRDITLDSALLQIILYENKFPTTEISAGSNLLSSPLLLDIGKINKMFTVIREGEGRVLYENLKILSKYIRHAITDKKTSVWIAQRNGRTKNGDDRTEIALLKMLHASYDGEFVPGFADLNMVPISISYEYEPCDGLKTQENYASVNTPYIKAPGEDLTSIITGILQPKGRIHMQFGNPLNLELPTFDPSENLNSLFKLLTEKIDDQIHLHYHLFPSNFIAHDLISKNSTFSDRYSPEEKDQFQAHTQKTLSSLQGDQNLLEKILLNLYAFPVRNYFSQTRSERTKKI